MYVELRVVDGIGFVRPYASAETAVVNCSILGPVLFIKPLLFADDTSLSVTSDIDELEQISFCDANN